MRGDTFVVETNIHYPTESSLIGDGLRKVMKLAAALAKDYGLPGWRQHEHLLKNVKDIVRTDSVGCACQGARCGATQAGVSESYWDWPRICWSGPASCSRPWRCGRTAWARLAWRRDRRLGAGIAALCAIDGAGVRHGQRRVLLGEAVANEEKIFSIFEPHTELIKRGKQPNPIQYGHNVLVIEDAAGFICHYEVVAKSVLDQDLVVPVMKKLQQRFDGKIKRASFDRGFHTPENQENWRRSCGSRVFQRRVGEWSAAAGRSDAGFSPSPAEPSGGGVGDRGVAIWQRPGAQPRPQQAWLPALRGSGHPGPQSAGAG